MPRMKLLPLELAAHIDKSWHYGASCDRYFQDKSNGRYSQILE